MPNGIIMVSARRVRTRSVTSDTGISRLAISSIAGMATSSPIAINETTGSRARAGASWAGSNRRSS